MSGVIVYTAYGSQGQPLASIDDDGTVRAFDMSAVRNAAASGVAAGLFLSTGDATALLILYAYSQGRASI